MPRILKLILCQSFKAIKMHRKTEYLIFRTNKCQVIRKNYNLRFVMKKVTSQKIHNSFDKRVSKWMNFFAGVS